MDEPSQPLDREQLERRVARAIYRSLRRREGAYVIGAPAEGLTTIDGTFSLLRVARGVLKALER
jgi:hypothetical protein